MQYYRSAKGAIRQQEQEKVKSDHARQRFEFRKLRMERAEQEKEAKRLARKQAAEQAKQIAAERKAAASTQADAPDTVKDDPVAAALARVKAKEQDPAAQKAKLERALDSATSRVEKLQQRFVAAEADQKEKFEAQLKQAQLRLDDAKTKLQDFSTASQPNEVNLETNLKNNLENSLETKAKDSTASPEQTQSLKPAAAETMDAATAAIERAKAKTQSMAEMSPEEKLKAQLTALETRVQKAKEKLQKAEADGSEHVEALRTGLEKMTAKLVNTQEQLEQLSQ